MEENTLEQGIEETGGDVLLFQMGEPVYALDVKNVIEIINIEKITKIPKIPSYIKGVINLRGKIVSVISLRGKFSMEEIPYDDRTCIIVIEKNGEQAGLIVDRVVSVQKVNPTDFLKASDCKNINKNKYINNIISKDDNVYLMLDSAKVTEGSNA